MKNGLKNILRIIKKLTFFMTRHNIVRNSKFKIQSSKSTQNPKFKTTASFKAFNSS